jgi:hypothetical protein
MSTALIARPDNSPEFASYPDEIRTEIRAWLKALQPVFGSKRIQAALHDAARSMGVSYATARLKYDLLRKSMDWRVLVNRSKVRPAEEKFPEQFVAWLRKMAEDNQRCSSAALREIKRHYHRGGEIPGYAVRPPADPATGLPVGWSDSNLRRHIKLTKFELKAARIGRTAASSHRPLVYTTRRGLYVGSHYMFDDMWHNLFVNSFAELQAGRPLELFSHDLFSARKVRFGMMVRTRRDDGTMKQLSERMTRYVLAATLYLDGYSPRGTVLIAENGTAAIREEVEEALYDLTDGLITVNRAGMTGDPAHIGQFAGRAKGNFRFKASLESSNNLSQNEFAALPGQTGKDIAHRPEQLHGLLKYNDTLLAALSQLPPEKAVLLRMPLLEHNQFMQVAMSLYKNIEDYTDHELEGWIESGNVVNEMLIGNSWISAEQFLCLPAPEQAIVNAALSAGSIRTRPRKMSRREVWDLGAPSLRKLSGYGVVAIMGKDELKPRPMRDGRFEFKDQEVAPGTLRFEGVVRDLEGCWRRLSEGTYLCFVNPFASETLFVCDAKGGYLGESRAMTAACRADLEDVQRGMGQAIKTEAELLEPLRLRHLEDAREKRAMHEHNASVADSSTPDDIDRAKQKKKAEKKYRTVTGELADDYLNNI